jgi:dihydrolipoamide dehydrogenase
VIATGSDIARLKGIEIDEKRIVSSTGALSLDKVPGKLLIVGAGVIGLELGSVWKRLGAEVRRSNSSIASCPAWTARSPSNSSASWKSRALQFKLGAKVTAVDTSGKSLKASHRAGGRAAPRRRWKPTWCSSASAACRTRWARPEGSRRGADNRGRVQIDRHFATSVKGVYAIGDVVAGRCSAHKAEDEGVGLCEIIAGQAGPRELRRVSQASCIPRRKCPSSARRGGAEAGGSGVYRREVSLTANGRSKVNQTTDGFREDSRRCEDRRVLGVHIIGREGRRNDP